MVSEIFLTIFFAIRRSEDFIDSATRLAESAAFAFPEYDAMLYQINASASFFGSPNPFLDAAIKRLSRHGVLAVTATDTAPLAGTYPKACARKYWARPLRNELQHEIGMRILIRKVQLIAAQYDKALHPVLVHYTRHYLRTFLFNKPGKKAVDSLLKLHDEFVYCKTCGWDGSCHCGKGVTVGPMYLGPLHEATRVARIIKRCDDSPAKDLLERIYEECAIQTVGFYDIPVLCKRLKTCVPPFAALLDLLKKKGHKASRTHFALQGIRTTASLKEMNTFIRSLGACP